MHQDGVCHQDGVNHQDGVYHRDGAGIVFAYNYLHLGNIFETS